MDLRPGGEGQARLLVGLDLVDGRKDVLDRVLDRHHVAGVVADLGERGVERRRLAAAGRAGAEHHAERGPDEVRVGLVRVGGHAELAQAEDRAGLVEDPHDALLAPDGGDGGHPDVDLLAVDLCAQLAVLGPTPFDDVHAGHDLDAADQADAHGGGERQDFLERAVDPVAHPDAELGRFDVDVRGAVALGLGQDAAHDLDDRRVVGDDLGVSGRRLDRPSSGALDGLEGLDEVVDAADGPVVVVDRPAHLGQRGQHRTDRGPACLAQERDELRRGLVGHRDVEADLVERHGDHEVLACHGVRDEVQRLGLWIGLPKVGDVHPVELGTRGDEAVLVEDPHADEHVAKVAQGGDPTPSPPRAVPRSRGCAAGAPSGAGGWTAR